MTSSSPSVPPAGGSISTRRARYPNPEHRLDRASQRERDSLPSVLRSPFRWQPYHLTQGSSSEQQYLHRCPPSAHRPPISKFLEQLFSLVNRDLLDSAPRLLSLLSVRRNCSSASRTIESISESDNPLEAVIFTSCSLPVALSTARTLTIPFASISKVTSI